MLTQTLNGNWLLRRRGTMEWLQAQAPGSVHLDLLAAGRIPDPFFGTNEEKVQWVAETDWEYRRYFHPTPTMLAQEHIFLVCSGLDTLAEVRLNGKILGVTNNMFLTWQWEVKGLLREGENQLDILFRSPVAHVRQRQRAKPMGDPNPGIRGGPYLRKTPSHFGWDWGPRLPCIGVWQEARLEGYSGGRLGEVRFEQKHENGMVMLTTRVACELSGPPEAEHRSIRLRVTAPDRQVWQADAPARPLQTIPIIITNPELWWPNGLGAPALYRVEVDLLEEDPTRQETRAIDSRAYQLGLRTIELRQVEDTYGTSFTFAVNGVPVFCKGSNWIPADSFPTRVSAEQLEHLIRSAAESHQNMLRVWGGGYYESDLFYDLCDRYGILVWQDFQFACATYPLDDPAYVESARCEIVENVRRLRHHACLALWCGNNEIELLSEMLSWKKKFAGLLAAHEQFFYQDLPALLAVEDPDRPYWPGSPSAGQPFNQPNSEKSGDAHLWEVYHLYRQPHFYRLQHPRFASEFGFQSLPAVETVAGFAPQKDWRLGSKVMKRRQRSLAGNSKLRWYLSRRFHLPRTFEGLVYLSQVFQAETVRTGVEHWRRHPERTSGALYWQLNDCWPAISWSSIDYNGRWKALHYAAKRFFAPLLLSIEEESEQRKAAVWLSNDTRAAWQGRLRWTLETLEGEVLEGGDQAVQCEPLSATCLLRKDFAPQQEKADWRRTVFTAELWQGETRLAAQMTCFLPEKAMCLGNPGLHAGVVELAGENGEGSLLSIRVTAQRLARFVELRLEGANVLFSDNFFDLPARRSIEITCPLPAGWTVEQAREALRLRSLAEIGPVEAPLVTGLKGAWLPADKLADLVMKSVNK